MCQPLPVKPIKEMCLQRDEGKTGDTSRGLSDFSATLFLVGEVAGCGLLSFPWALSRTGWIGLPIIITFAGAAIYCATLLGRCWMIVSERHVSCGDQPVRHPYPLIGEVAFGKPCRQLISVCVNLTSCGSCVAYLLLVAQNLMTLFPGDSTGYAFWLVTTAAVLCPFCWLGTPKDFWLIAISAVLTTVLASVVIVSQMLRDASHVPPAFHGPVDFKSFLMAFGLLCFGFGGHQVFPTIQVDMQSPEKFGYSAAIGFSSVLCMYIPVAVIGYMIYGSNLQDNVLVSILPGPLQSIAMVLMSAHLLAAFVIILNPVNQEMEDRFAVPNCFCVRRVLLRTVIVGVLLFVALSVPQFGAILALVGGSTMACLMFIIPTASYLKLSAMHGDWDSVEVPLHEKVLCVEIIVVGAVAGAAATYSALDALTYSHFSRPLYLS
ncbi:hypothetical protein EGW08_018176 [Elysia chlorotica]|uniref:Amino acid transporter transmembrane domain-containing protein n=1 Tax=Elysia chlorotica TaxID=188477 RepID=A0A433SXL1_ELYCH|nr:hypothetical protein EGW08_018176 [Elysia chlorotica]